MANSTSVRGRSPSPKPLSNASSQKGAKKTNESRTDGGASLQDRSLDKKDDSPSRSSSHDRSVVATYSAPSPRKSSDAQGEKIDSAKKGSGASKSLPAFSAMRSEMEGLNKGIPQYMIEKLEESSKTSKMFHAEGSARVRANANPSFVSPETWTWSKQVVDNTERVNHALTLHEIETEGRFKTLASVVLELNDQNRILQNQVKTLLDKLALQEE